MSEPQKTEEKPLSKKQLAKLEKEKKKEEAKRLREEQERKDKEELLERFKDTFGYRPMAEVISDVNPIREYLPFKNLNASHIGEKVWFRARVHNKKPVSSKFGFIMLRSKYYIAQFVMTNPTELVKFCSKIPNESVVDVYGEIVKPAVDIISATIKDVEVSIEKCFIVSEAISQLPLQIEDASRSNTVFEQQNREIAEIEKQIEEVTLKLQTAGTDEEKNTLNEQFKTLADQKSRANRYANVDQSVRLDYRVIDIRTPANHAIYTISSAFCSTFRKYLTQDGFIEIHTPKLLGSASEGGTEVFEVKYFDRKAYLAQSPQLFKQMAIVGDFGRVFEIGPVFRAEKSETHRHLTEFVGVDLEMEFNQHYHEVLRYIARLLGTIFEEINNIYDEELRVINEQYPFERLVFNKDEPLILHFSEAVKIINEEKEKLGDQNLQGEFDDLNTENEKFLGKIIKKRYGTDFYIIDKFPFDVRAFYSMRDPEDPRYGNAYDIFLRGEEISSGAQRVHIPGVLEKQAVERGINPTSLRAYIDSFSYGSNPHAGCGLGLERIVMLFLNIGNVRKTSLFPRDPYRLSP